MSSYIIAVEPNEYELPICQAETPTKLAKLLGISRKTIYDCLARGNSGKRCGYRFYYIDE